MPHSASSLNSSTVASNITSSIEDERGGGSRSSSNSDGSGDDGSGVVQLYLIGMTAGGGSKMFVGGLSWCTTRHSLATYFGLFGDIEDCTVVTNEQGRSRGFGFVTYRDPCIAFIVCQRGPHSVDNRVVDPKPCGQNGNHIKVPGRVMRPYPKVFTGGLPASLTENELGQFFRENYGNVLEVVIMFDQESQRSRGFGFVTFQEERVADKVCREHYITIKGKKVECNRAQPRFLPTCSSAVIQLPFGNNSSSGSGGSGSGGSGSSASSSSSSGGSNSNSSSPSGTARSSEDGASGNETGCSASGLDDVGSLVPPSPSRSLFGYDYGMDRATGGNGSRRCAFIGPFRRIASQQKYAAFSHTLSNDATTMKDSHSGESLLSSFRSATSAVALPKGTEGPSLEAVDDYCCWRNIREHAEAGPSWKAPGNPLPTGSRSCGQPLID